MNQFLKRANMFLATYWPEISVFVASVVVAIANYSPGTWLIGWDNLLPEINIWLNLKRTLFSAWQENQGLGLVGGIGHAADLSRQLLLLPFVLTLPASMIRYAWTFAMLALGPLGAIQLGKYVVKNWSIPKQQENLTVTLGGLFYLLNIATVQYFFVPLETFSSFYGFLPWMLWAAIAYLNSGKRKHLVHYLVIHVLGTSSFHVQTLFVVYCIVLSLFIFSTVLRDKANGIKKAMALGISTILIHSFWLLPVLYFTFTNADMTVLSKQNLFSTPEAQLMNQAYGTITDILSLKGYWFEYTDYADSKTVYLLETWREHYSLPLTRILSYFIPLTSILGFCAYCTMLIKQKKKLDPVQFSIILATILSFEMLTAGNGLIGLPFKLISNSVPLFGQMFRVAFTKWSIVFTLFISLGLVHFIAAFFQIFKKRLKELPVVFALLTAFVIIWNTAPIFSGSLVYNKMRIVIPDEYFELFAFFKSQPKQARILHLPAETMWGWSFYSWDYRGSGFLWYGIEQPIVDRNFDVWSSHNEGLYTQLLHAIQTTDTTSFINLVNTYDISYILVDQNKVSPSANTNIQSSNAQTQIFDDLNLRPVWHSNNLYVYATGDQQITKSFVASPTSFKSITNDSHNTTSDVVFAEHNTYITAADSKSQLTYPFAYLGERAPLHEVSVDLINATFASRGSIEKYAGNVIVRVPKLTNKVSIAPIGSFKRSDTSIDLQFEPLFSVLTNNSKTDFAQLPSISIPVTNDQTQKIYLLINNQIIDIESLGSNRVLFETIEVGKPITIGYVLSEYVTIDESDVITIDASKVETVFIAETLWDELITEKSIPIPQSEIGSLRISTPIVNHIQQIDQLSNSVIQNCDVFKRGTATKEHSFNSIKFSSANYASGCDGVFLKGVSSKRPILLQLKQHTESGRPMRMYLEHRDSHTVLFEDFISQNESWIVQDAPPLVDSPYYLGIENRSFGQDSINNLTKFSVIALPISTDLLAGIQILDSEVPTTPIQNLVQPTVTQKIGTHFYSITLEPNHGEGIITLSQSFDAGWIAFTDEGLLGKNAHVKVNNWKNGWIVPANSKKIYLIFYPQIAVFLGLFSIPLLFLFLKTRKDS